MCQSPPNPLPIPSAVEQLSMDLEDAHNQVRVHQRKNASSLKDLTKQLQHYRKYVLTYVFVRVPVCAVHTCWGLRILMYIFVRVPVYVHTYMLVGFSVYVFIRVPVCTVHACWGLCVCIYIFVRVPVTYIHTCWGLCVCTVLTYLQ